MKLAVYLFKRDLRFEDNRGLLEASKYEKVLPLFIFDDDILTSLEVGEDRLGYIVNFLENKNIYVLKGKTVKILEEIFQKYNPDALITTKSFSWSGIQRNEDIKSICIKYGVKYVEVLDNFLVDPNLISEKKVYTHFYNEWIKNLDLTVYNYNINILETDLPNIKDLKINYKKQNIDCNKLLDNYDFSLYDKTRNFPWLDSSKLSPCIRFGVLSLRKIFEKAKISIQYIKELAWREFWYHIAIRFPWTKDINFQQNRKVLWENNENYIKVFLEGKTGYPIIDAGIRQLKQENWVHNRIRMLLASFLTKVLLVDWKIGEEFFKKYLIDYDEVVNIGNWQRSASVGADPKPFRFFNPILQAEKFDNGCKYIKKYLFELKDLPCEWLKNPLKYKLPYYKPIVDYYERLLIIRKNYGLKI